MKYKLTLQLLFYVVLLLMRKGSILHHRNVLVIDWSKTLTHYPNDDLSQTTNDRNHQQLETKKKSIMIFL